MNKENTNTQVIEEEDDFTFGNEDESKTDGNSTDKTESDEKDDQNEEDDDVDQESSTGKEDKEKAKDAENEDKVDDSEEDDEDEKPDQKDEKDDKDVSDDKKEKANEDEKEEEEDDIFASKENEQEDQESKDDLSSLAKDLEIEIEDGQELNRKTFAEKLQEKIDGAKQEFNLDQYNDQAKKVIDHLQKNDGDLSSFFENELILSMRNVINMAPEEKFRSVRGNELASTGLKSEEIQERLDEEIESMSTRELKDAADKIDNSAKSVEQKEIEKIIGNHEEEAEKQRKIEEKKIEKERENLNKFIKKQDEFLGIKFSEKAKKAFTNDLESGKFDNIVDQSPESSKFYAYMFAKYGDKIEKQITGKMAESNREGYNNATDKHKKALHNVGEKSGKTKSGHKQEQSTGKWDGFSNIE